MNYDPNQTKHDINYVRKNNYDISTPHIFI